MEVYLIRHTRPQVEKGICYGQLDLELAPSFPDELAELKAKLPSEFDRVFTSPLIRCKQLAQALHPHPRSDERLIELDFGQWEGQAWDEIPAAELDPWMQDFVHQAPPRGEKFLDMQKRVLAFWMEIKPLKQQNIAICTHSGVIRTLWAYLERKTIQEAFSEFQIDYGGIYPVKVGA